MRSWTLLAGCVLGLLAVACDSNPEPPTTTPAPPDATSVKTPVDPEACPIARDACDFAEEIVEGIVNADTAKLDALSAPEQFECFGPVAGGLGGPYPLCDGSVAGEVRDGFYVHVFNSDGGTVQGSILPSIRDAVLGGGPGVAGLSGEPPRIVGIHCPTSADASDCREEFVVYFDGAPHVGVKRVNQGLRVGWLQFGNFAEDPSVLQTGGGLAYAHKELLPGRFWPWRPAPTQDALDAVKERWLFTSPPVADLRAEPSEGACPAEVALSIVPAPGPFPPGKEPVPIVRLFPGVVGRNHGATARTGYVEVAPTGSLSDGKLKLEIPPSACQSAILTIVLAGDEWRIAGYRVE